MIKQRFGSRDVALTTLIDLLVQVVFVFTLLLIASGAIEGTPEERGYIPVSSEAWKTLVSIFDVDLKKPAREQAKDIQERFQSIKRERDDLSEVNRKLKETIEQLDTRIAQLEKQRGGAPGLPPCRTVDGSEIAVIRADINSSGNITVALLNSAQIEHLTVDAEAVGRALSRMDFQRYFDHWKARSLARVPPCKYVAAVVQYDPEAKAGDYQPAVAAILHVFRIQQIVRAPRY